MAEEAEKKSKARKRYEIPKTATCNVCGDVAAEHLHYGGIACYSCRAFFRRTVNSNRPILECSNDQNCKIDKHTRKRCQFCRFEKCKAAGMKTSWVLTEDDKSKVAASRRPPPTATVTDPEEISFKSAPGDLGAICIKTEAGEAEPVLGGLEQGLLSVKQRRPSSPMTPAQFRPASSQLFPGPGNSSDSQIYSSSGLSGQYPSAYPGLYPNPGYSYPTPPVVSNMSAMFPFPVPVSSINTMHQMSLSSPGPGDEGLTSPRPQESPASPVPGSSGGGIWHSSMFEAGPLVKKHKRHHQQSRTIFRCVSGDTQERDCDSRSTVSSQMSDTSPSSIPLSFGPENPMRPNIGLFNNRSQFSAAFSPNDSIQSNSSDTLGHAVGDHLKAHVWKLQDVSVDNEDGESQEGYGSPGLSPVNTFTLQETLFVEQLSSIDERVRLQVPMGVGHGRSFLDCAVSGSPISQTTIMHAYQTCIKRIVRFANSLQDFVELPPDDMQKLLVSNTVSIINIKISRWLSEDLKTQMGLLGTNHNLYKEAVDAGRLTEDLNMKVDYSDIFISPWCCDSSHEDRYEALVQQMKELELDPTTVVLLSVMSLFYISQSQASSSLAASSTIASHQRKFSLLLQRYLLQSKGRDRTAELYAKYLESLEKLHEMAEILINKRLICW